MFKAPSLQTEYTLVFSGDPALQLPDDPEERANVLRVARETGNYAPITREGEQLTLFHVRPLSGSLFQWVFGEMNRKQLTAPEGTELALRAALRRISNFGAHKVKLARNEDGHELADRATLDALYDVVPEDPSIGRALIAELGSEVITRAMHGLSPKS